MDGNYASPITVNGFSCDNCAQVALAKKDINPAHPNWTPGETQATAKASALNTPSVILAGALQGVVSLLAAVPPPVTSGGLLNISA